jgi:2-keto-4-pentenoate hydratase
MKDAMIRDAADFLRVLWQEEQRCSALPPTLLPLNRSDAYRIQALHEVVSAAPLAGWKIAATSVAGQKHIGVNGPLAGRYIAERIVPSGGEIPFGSNHMRVAEVEFAFRMGRDLIPRFQSYTQGEVFDAIASAHPAIEIPDSRYDRFETVGAAALIADNACAHWMAIGDAMPERWRDVELAEFQPVGRIAGKSDVTGKGSNVLGSPRIAMTWLANELSGIGVTLRAGQFVTTGTCLIPMPIARGDHVTGDFGALGKIDVRLA